jgi:serine protease Do
VAQVRNEQASRRNAVAALNDAIQKQSDRISALEGQNAVLGKRLSATQKNLRLSKAGVAPLAQRILRSVFTVDTPDGLGTGWAAWIQDGDTYLITANHVAQDAITNGTRGVTVKQKARSWRGTIVKTDSVNDLATIRVHGNIAPPLWQRPDDSITPLAGDQLLLVGSPYGLEGTVTTGVVSRVAYDEIQTDAAANPGNSGGPGLDEHGGVVGVLLSGGGENLNFLVPIQRACVTVRDC